MHFVKTLEYRKNMQTNTVSLYFLLVVKNRGFRRGSSLSTSHATTETKQDKTWTTVVSQATIDPSVVKRVEAHILERAMAVAAVERAMHFHASVPISTTLILFPTTVEDRLRRCFLSLLLWLSKASCFFC